MRFPSPAAITMAIKLLSFKRPPFLSSSCAINPYSANSKRKSSKQSPWLSMARNHIRRLFAVAPKLIIPPPIDFIYKYSRRQGFISHVANKSITAATQVLLYENQLLSVKSLDAGSLSRYTVIGPHKAASYPERRGKCPAASIKRGLF